MNIPNEYKNLSEIAKASGKRLNNWVNRSEGKKAIADFLLKYPEIDNPLVTKQGKGGGTWGHPELAAIFAAWCDPRFTAEVVEQNAQLREQNELLKEKIRTFQVDTPAQIAARLDEVVEVKRFMINEDPSIQESLLQLSIELGHPLDKASVEKLYQNARDLLSHISSTPVTFARVAGTLLVYHIQEPDGEELRWFQALPVEILRISSR